MLAEILSLLVPAWVDKAVKTYIGRRLLRARNNVKGIPPRICADPPQQVRDFWSPIGYHYVLCEPTLFLRAEIIVKNRPPRIFSSRSDWELMSYPSAGSGYSLCCLGLLAVADNSVITANAANPRPKTAEENRSEAVLVIPYYCRLQQLIGLILRARLRCVQTFLLRLLQVGLLFTLLGLIRGA